MGTGARKLTCAALTPTPISVNITSAMSGQTGGHARPRSATAPGWRLANVRCRPASTACFRRNGVDNRPFLRALHGLGLCQWRLGDFTAARETFWRLLMLNPYDNLGVRFLIDEVEAGRDYLT